MLAIGACVVLDRTPFPAWPIPLREGENFLSLELGITEDCKPAPEYAYNTIAEKAKRFLENQNVHQRIGINNISYFKKIVRPWSFSKYIIKSAATPPISGNEFK